MDTLSLCALGAIFSMIAWILYSTYDDFTLNNDPDGRRLRSQNRKLRRKKKLLQRLRRELKAEQKLTRSESSSSSSEQSSSSCSSTTTDKARKAAKDRRSNSTMDSATEDDLKSIEAEIQLETEAQEFSKPKGFWQVTITKVNDFFSDEAVVPESDTDQEDLAGAASSFVMIPEQDSPPLCATSSSYRRLRMSVVRHGHSWDPNF